MAFGEIFLGSFFQVLLDKLTSLAVDCVQREGSSTVPLDEWKGMLATINAVLDGAEDKQLSGDDAVKLWLDDVRDLAYDIEDLLDDFEIQATQAKSEAESSTSRGQLKRKFAFLSRPRSLVSKDKVQEINVRLEKILTRKDLLSLRENAVDRSNSTNKRLPSTSLPELQFFGREEEEAELVKRLISNVQDSDATLNIIPIIGMAGVGKTALAQRLYNHPTVSKCFRSRAWACVSDVFDVLNITKTILQLFGESACEGKDLNWLQVKLKDYLSGKKFLVVLDDIWNEKYEEWTFLLKPFEVGAKGSKIIITTRNHSVVSITGASPYLLKELSIDNCISLLAHHALGARNFERRPDLETIGQKIAGKCGGLPLTAKILGGLLRNKENPDEWEDILNNRIWDVTTGKKDEVLPALKLSYQHLPSHLKRCFAYCAVFPKDYEIERDELALLWMAEGFLDGQKAKKDILRSGQNSFDELVSRSFFQQSSVNTSKFIMHDLLNDLAKLIAGTTCFTSGESQVVGDADDASFEEKARYASFVSTLNFTSNSLRAYAEMKVLRSLLTLNVQFHNLIGRKFISKKVLHELLSNLTYLRALSLCHYNIIEVPNCVGDLTHLRYLNLSYTYIKRLPESIGTLGKLQALMLKGCRDLAMLPPDITKLVNLQILDIRDTPSLKDMPLNISNLKNLILLPKFVVGSENGPLLKELKNLPHLQGELLVSNLQKVEEVRDAVAANLCERRGLNNLLLLWDEDFGNLRNNSREEEVLHHLKPHTNLEHLTISYYGGAIFPSWLGGPCYSKIVSLCLRGCPNVMSLPPLGQLPSLEELYLEGLHAVRTIGSEFCGGKKPFSSLTTLKFKDMSAWEDWSCYAEGRQEEVSFSCLRHLVVWGCPSLVQTLPCQLDHLIKLEICSCRYLINSTSEVNLPSLGELYLKDSNKEILKSLVNLTSLTTLRITNLAELVCFDHGFMSYLIKLREFRIGRCDMLISLWQDRNDMLNLTCLQKLVIVDCARFTSFVAGEGEIELPYNLEGMELTRCGSLEKFPSKMHALKRLTVEDCPKLKGQIIPSYDASSNYPMSQLEYLRISKCDSLTSILFAEGRLAALKKLSFVECKGVESLEEITMESLESLTILRCKNLRNLPRYLHTLSHLTHLTIDNCPALEMEDFPPLPITLSSLDLGHCPKIKSIASCNIASCKNLRGLAIIECPIEDCPPLPITLSYLELRNCPKIKSLPNRWHHLISLQKIMIHDCPSIECFPKGGWPPNLRALDIISCENVKQPLREWGLPFLTSLQGLRIDGISMGGEGEKVLFPSDADVWTLLFPSSLTSLSIFNMRNVERLSSGLRNHLSSLHYLNISDCPKLRDLLEDDLPPSLQRLEIDNCEKIPKDRYSKLADKIPSR